MGSLSFLTLTAFDVAGATGVTAHSTTMLRLANRSPCSRLHMPGTLYSHLYLSRL